MLPLRSWIVLCTCCADRTPSEWFVCKNVQCVNLVSSKFITTLLIVFQFWEFFNRQKPQSFLNQFIDFHLNWVTLYNLDIWFSKIFCFRSQIIFWHKMPFRNVIAIKIIGFLRNKKSVNIKQLTYLKLPTSNEHISDHAGSHDVRVNVKTFRVEKGYGRCIWIYTYNLAFKKKLNLTKKEVSDLFCMTVVVLVRRVLTHEINQL